jgi:GNAT superfamily N-acetyltransferase
MTNFTIEDFPIPESADDPQYVAIIDIQNQHRTHVLGAAAANNTPAEILPYLQDHTHDKKRIAVAKVGDTVVGSVLMVWQLIPDTRVTYFDLGVAPAYRNQGIGTALLAEVEAETRAAGRPVLQVGAVHEAIAESEMLPAPTGFGAVPLADPGFRFLQHHGFQLEQVYRISTVELPVAAEVLATYEEQARAKAGDEYRVLTWHGDTPADRRADVAELVSRLATDAPTGNLEVEPEPWDAERVRQNDERRQQAGRLQYAAVVEHVPSGKLVAFNGVSVPSDDPTRPAQQGITLVLKEHRGHRLGMLVKVANIREVMANRPETPFIITDNAEENRPMLDVNEAVGFKAVAYEGAWQKVLD